MPTHMGFFARSEEQARMEELAIMGGFADTKFLTRTLSSQVHRLRARSETLDNYFFFFEDIYIILPI